MSSRPLARINPPGGDHRLVVELTVRPGWRGASAARCRSVLSGAAARLSVPPARVSVLFTGDEEIARVNRRMRQTPRPTDVLSFPAGDDSPAPGPLHLGDIVVSIETAARQARARDIPVDREVLTLLLHGFLHLLGYDHESDGGEMMRLQGRLAVQVLPRDRAPAARRGLAAGPHPRARSGRASRTGPRTAR